MFAPLLAALAACSSSDPAPAPVLPAANALGGPDISQAVFSSIDGHFISKRDQLDLQTDGTFEFHLDRPTAYWASHVDGSTVKTDSALNADCQLDLQGKAVAVGDSAGKGTLAKLHLTITSAQGPSRTGTAMRAGARQLTPARVCGSFAAQIKSQGTLDVIVHAAAPDHLSLAFTLNFAWDHGSLRYTISGTEPRGPGAVFVKAGIPPIDVTSGMLPKLAGSYRMLNDDGTRPAAYTLGTLTIDGQKHTFSMLDNACWYTASGNIDRIVLGGGIAKIVMSGITVAPITESPDTQASAGLRSDCTEMQSSWTQLVATSFVGLEGDPDSRAFQLELPTHALALDGDWGADRAEDTDASDFELLHFQGTTF